MAGLENWENAVGNEQYHLLFFFLGMAGGKGEVPFFSDSGECNYCHNPLRFILYDQEMWQWTL